MSAGSRFPDRTPAAIYRFLAVQQIFVQKLTNLPDDAFLPNYCLIDSLPLVPWLVGTMKVLLPILKFLFPGNWCVPGPFYGFPNCLPTTASGCLRVHWYDYPCFLSVAEQPWYLYRPIQQKLFFEREKRDNANLVAACSLPDYNAGEARRREHVCFPGGFSIKAALCIDVCVLVSTVCCLLSRQSFDIPCWPGEGCWGDVLNEREVLLDFVSLVYLKWFDSNFHPDSLSLDNWNLKLDYDNFYPKFSIQLLL